MAEAAKRLAFWGPVIVGILGVILAFNAALSDQYAGAGTYMSGGVRFGLRHRRV